jgi:acetyl esterase/lipase
MKLFVNSVVWVVLLVLTAVSARAEEKVVRLYEGTAPGSEGWTQKEGKQHVEFLGGDIVTNVVDPTLTVFEPAEGKSVGTGIVICPGGGFHILSVDSEGYDVARWLAARGVTCFVLKYRLKETKTDNPFGEMMANLQNFKETIGPVVKLATHDALAALAYVRKHAAEYGVQPNRIGIIGFSAGGMVAAETACHFGKPQDRPDFAAAIYPAWPEGASAPPADAPPMFIAAATDDQFSLVPDSLRLYQQWVAAKKPVELHIYAEGGHGFGMRKQGKPTDKWIEQFATWLGDRGLLGNDENK